jgi:hypothetical protein
MYSLLEDSPGPVNTYFTSATAMDFVQHEGAHGPRGGVGLRKRRVTKSWTKIRPVLSGCARKTWVRNKC